eukprot:2795787-Pyramimonas_sp.AAC.1
MQTSVTVVIFGPPRLPEDCHQHHNLGSSPPGGGPPLCWCLCPSPSPPRLRMGFGSWPFR